LSIFEVITDHTNIDPTIKRVSDRSVQSVNELRIGRGRRLLRFLLDDVKHDPSLLFSLADVGGLFGGVGQSGD
jgi:hypothetical protein